MFFNILSHFKDNRKKVMIIIVVVSLIIFFIRSISKYYSIQNSSSSNNTTAINTKVDENNKIIDNTNEKNTNNVEKNTTTTPTQLIDKFLEYCNNNQISEAYSLLTDDCKSIIYPTQESFYNNYYKRIFSVKRKHDYLKYGSNYGNTYKVIYKCDPLTTGKTGSNNEGIIDYFTVVKKDEEYKLNISELINSEKMDVKKSNEYLDAEVVEKDTYINYEIYTVKIKNNTLVDMILGETTSNLDIFLEDKNKNKFLINIDEQTQKDLTINDKKESTIKLKFDRKYDDKNEKKDKLVFSNIKLVNRLYYDNTIQEKQEDGSISYKERYTTYKNNFSFEIELKS